MYIFATTDEYVLGRSCSARSCNGDVHITIVDSRLTPTRLGVLISRIIAGPRYLTCVEELYAALCQSVVAAYNPEPERGVRHRKVNAAKDKSLFGIEAHSSVASVETGPPWEVSVNRRARV
jgi:hypothetical protein